MNFIQDDSKLKEEAVWWESKRRVSKIGTSTMDLLKNQRSTDDLKKKTLSQTAYLQVSFAKDTKENEILKASET